MLLKITVKRLPGAGNLIFFVLFLKSFNFSKIID